MTLAAVAVPLRVAERVRHAYTALLPAYHPGYVGQVIPTLGGDSRCVDR